MYIPDTKWTGREEYIEQIKSLYSYIKNRSLWGGLCENRKR